MSSFTYQVEFKMHETKNKTFMRLNTFVFLAEFPNSDGHDGDFLDSSPSLSSSIRAAQYVTFVISLLKARNRRKRNTTPTKEKQS